MALGGAARAGFSTTLNQVGLEASFSSLTKSGNRLISAAITAHSVTCCSVMLVESRALLPAKMFLLVRPSECCRRTILRSARSGFGQVAMRTRHWRSYAAGSWTGGAIGWWRSTYLSFSTQQANVTPRTKKLTDAGLRAALKGGTPERRELPDGSVLGLTIRLRPGGATWSLILRVVSEGGISKRGHRKKGPPGSGDEPEPHLPSAARIHAVFRGLRRAG
jgi:hypothetical protein